MADKDLGEELENIEEGIENLKNKEFRLLGIKMTPLTIGALFTAISTVVGMLYAGFLMYQKIENIAGFVDGADEFNQKIQVLEQRLEKTEASLAKTEDFTTKSLEAQRNTVARLQTQTDRIEDRMGKLKDDVGSMIDLAEQRFESKRDQLRSTVSRDTKDIQDKIDRNAKELEDRVNKKIQQALDNPLAN